MSRNYYKNRRITYRDNVSIIGKLFLKKDNNIFYEYIHINDISYDGMKVVFADNEFLYKYLDYIDNNGIISTEFDYENKRYFFDHTINWLRIFDYGERNLYVLTALNYKDIKKIEEELLELINLIQMENFHLG